MNRDSRSRLHASAWRSIEENAPPSDAIRKADELVDLARVVSLGKLSETTDAHRQSLSRQFLELSETVCEALKQLDAEVRELRDGVKQLSKTREQLQDELGEARYQLKEVHELQCKQKYFKRKLAVSGHDLMQFKEECCGLNKRVLSLQAALQETREHRDDLLQEFSRRQDVLPLERPPKSVEEAEHLRFLFTDEGPDKSQLGRGLHTLGTYRPPTSTEPELRFAGPLREFSYNHCLHPAIALGKHFAMMIVFHHGFVAHGAAHATSTMMHHGIAAGSSAASTTGVSGGATALHHVGNSLLHQGTHSLIRGSSSDGADNRASWTTQSRQRKAKARDERESSRVVKVLNFLPPDGSAEAREKLERYSAGRPIARIVRPSCNSAIKDVDH